MVGVVGVAGLHLRSLGFNSCSHRPFSTKPAVPKLLGASTLGKRVG